jgi:hypothetical protein
VTLQVPPQANRSGAVHFDPEKVGRLNKPVIVLRKVNVKKLQKRETPTSDTAWELIGKGQVQLHLREDQLPWYAEGLIVLDQPRDEKVARDIMRATIGFAIARTDTGEVLKAYGPNNLMEAIEDAASVTLSIRPVLERLAQTKAAEVDDEELVARFLEEHANVIDEAPEAEEV